MKHETQTQDEEAARLAHEAKLIEKARVQLAAGQGRTGPDFEAWLTRWEGDNPLLERRERD